MSKLRAGMQAWIERRIDDLSNRELRGVRMSGIQKKVLAVWNNNGRHLQ